MEFKLTSSQKNFYTKNVSLDSSIWNHGVMQIFPKVYTYEQLNDAYNSLVKAHDSIRVKMKETENGPVMILEDFRYKNFPFFQFSSEEELMTAAKSFVDQSLDHYGDLIKCAIFQTPVSSGLMICANHIVVDGYSSAVMADHVYHYLQDENFMPPAYQSYQEYVEKEENHKTSKRFLQDQKFWKEQFSSDPVCNLGFDQTKMFDYNADEENCEISPEFFEKIKVYCKNNDISPATFFNTIYAAYINRYFELDNFTIGIPVLNRFSQAELNTVGLYMHIIPLIVNIQSDSFLATAQKIEDSQMNLFRHQKFTQYDIKDLLKENKFSVNQLFDVIADYEVLPNNEYYEVRFQYGSICTVPIEIHLFNNNNDSYKLKIRYRTALFSETDIRLMMDSVLHMAAEAIENADFSISETSLYSERTITETILKIKQLNNTKTVYCNTDTTTLYSLFEKTAKNNSEALCISSADRNVTFGEFLDITENLDKEIRKITLGKKSIIAVICERSVEMYGAVYGIIRGGNAYLPISPDYPKERIEYILKNSNAALVVAQDKFIDLAGDVPSINMTSFINTPYEKSEYIPYAAKADDTAYVIYTSGSTGNPKGAKISHRSAVNRILWMHEKYPLQSDSVILQKTPYTFDVSVWELFWWGMCSGKLAASKPGEHFLPAKILEETAAQKVTHLHFVPSVFDLFLTYLENHKDEIYKFNSVKYVFLSGEALTASLIQRFYALFDSKKVGLHNLYGPTECAVDVSFYDCSPSDIDPVPIGKPIGNTMLYVVDKHMNPVPFGVKGELLIGGVNVGQGYLNNPALTQEKFIPNPFDEGMIYKTGDLAFWREDGQIIFCGRMDNQIKLNGQRIEIGEIEAVIESIPEIETAAVLLQKINNKDMLVAYYCAPGNSDEIIHEVCSEKLPKYMIPSAFCRVDKMPLNQSGKLDRKALKEQKAVNILQNEFDSPVNDLEKFICEAFSKILGLNDIGRNSNFFSLGGTSLSMISLLSEDGFSDISAADLIANPTPKMLALILEAKRPKQYEYIETLLENREAKKAIVLFPYAGGGAEAFTKLTEEIQKTNKFSVYFVRYLHSSQECEQAATEIKDFFKEKELYFYSHCVGSAVALQILRIFEKENCNIVKHFLAGASVPLKKPGKKNIWNFVPDKLLTKILISAGASLKELPKDKLSVILQKFREDTDFAVKVFFDRSSSVECPLTPIISKNDIFTKDYKHAQKLWLKYSDNTQKTHFIDSDTHYFQADDAKNLSEIILSIIE